MISIKAAVAALLLLVGSTTAFDVYDCDIFVFRTEDQCLWDCGGITPDEKFCDHAPEDDGEPHAWASNRLDDWCDFMISTVRHEHQITDHYPLTEQINLTDTPGPSQNEFARIIDWGCYILSEDQSTTEHSWVVLNGTHAMDYDEDNECKLKRNKKYFTRLLEDPMKAVEDNELLGHLTESCKLQWMNILAHQQCV